MVKLLILDIDGVLTDGKKYYDLNGNTAFKTYCDKDFTAIKRFRAAGVHVCFLSGDEKINQAMAKNRNIDFFLSRNEFGGIDKATFINKFEELYGVERNEMCYVGDDIFDTSIMREVGFAYCLEDSPQSMKDEFKVIDRKGGENVIMRLFDMFVDMSYVEEPSFEKVNDLDKHEKF